VVNVDCAGRQRRPQRRRQQQQQPESHADADSTADLNFTAADRHPASHEYPGRAISNHAAPTAHGDAAATVDGHTRAATTHADERAGTVWQWRQSAATHSNADARAGIAPVQRRIHVRVRVTGRGSNW
jgi:hypothetical protein